MGRGPGPGPRGPPAGPPASPTGVQIQARIGPRDAAAKPRSHQVGARTGPRIPAVHSPPAPAPGVGPGPGLPAPGGRQGGPRRPTGLHAAPLTSCAGGPGSGPGDRTGAPRAPPGPDGPAGGRAGASKTPARRRRHGDSPLPLPARNNFIQRRERTPAGARSQLAQATPPSRRPRPPHLYATPPSLKPLPARVAWAVRPRPFSSRPRPRLRRPRPLLGKLRPQPPARSRMLSRSRDAETRSAAQRSPARGLS